MVKRPPLRLQVPVDHPLPRTHREVYAEALKAAEMELRLAQAAREADDSNENRIRLGLAIAENDRLAAMFPFVAAGLGDETV